MKLKQEIFEEFFKKCFSGKKSRDAAYALFFGEKKYCLCQQPGYDETDFLQRNIRDEERILGVPEEWYMNICKEGYQTFGFDTTFLDEAVKASCA